MAGPERLPHAVRRSARVPWDRPRTPERSGLHSAHSRPEHGASCGALHTATSSPPVPRRRRARTARCGRSPADSGSRTAARCPGRHSCNNPGRGATPPASRRPGCTVTGSPAPRRSSSARQGAAPVPANAPQSPPRPARRRPQAASAPKSEPGDRPAPVPASRCPGRLRTAVRPRVLHGPGHRPPPRPGHRRRFARAASAAKQPDRRCHASPSVARLRTPSPSHDDTPAPKPRRRPGALPPPYAGTRRAWLASAPNQGGEHYAALPRTSCRRVQHRHGCRCRCRSGCRAALGGARRCHRCRVLPRAPRRSAGGGMTPRGATSPASDTSDTSVLRLRPFDADESGPVEWTLSQES